MIDAIMQTERLYIGDVLRASGLARNTVQYVRRGKTHTPKLATLQRLARALATDPQTREIDRNAMTRYARQLVIAAGYADPDVAEAETLLELSLRYVLKSKSRAGMVAELVHRCEPLDDDAIRRLLDEAGRARGAGKQPRQPS